MVSLHLSCIKSSVPKFGSFFALLPAKPASEQAAVRKDPCCPCQNPFARKTSIKLRPSDMSVFSSPAWQCEFKAIQFSGYQHPHPYFPLSAQVAESSDERTDFNSRKIFRRDMHINIKVFFIRIIVTHKLPPDENLYLHCLTNYIRDTSLIRRLANDCAMHQEENVYRKYLDQLTTSSAAMKGGQTIVSEGLLNLFGTSSAEIIANTKKESKVSFILCHGCDPVILAMRICAPESLWPVLFFI